MSNLVKQEDIEMAGKLEVPVAILSELSPVQKGWLSMAVKRKNTTEVLTKSELAIQGFLKSIKDDNELPSVQNKLKKASDEAATAKDCRLQFTRSLDEKLITPLMEFEKRNEALINEAKEHEKTLRIEAHNKANAGQAKQEELNLYKAHIQNEQSRIRAEYRNTLSRRINFYYTGALEQKMPVTALKDYCADIAAELPMIELGVATKFNRVLVTVEDAKELLSKMPPMYDGKEDLADAIKEIDVKFAMYANDLQNAEEAIEAAKQSQTAKEASTSQEAAVDAAVNVLAAKANVASVDSGVKIKKTYKIIEYENESFAILIITNFLKKFDQVKGYLRNKSWMKLTLQQMTDALSKHITETGEVLVGITTEEVVK